MPVPDLTRTLLRRAVGELRRRETRRVFDASVHVGRLDADHESFVVRARDLPVLDAALRVEVVSRLVADAEPAPSLAWLVRAGDPEPFDVDADWCAAATTAFDMHGLTLAGFYAVTRYGWRDVRDGDVQTWRRLRL